jgi:hypothetical protein
MTAVSWQPARPALSPARAPARAPAHAPAYSPAISPGLAAAMAEKDTVIVLVVGAGPDSDRTERLCQGLARDPGFEAVRVVRVRDRTELTPPQLACWLAGERRLAVLGPDRRTALPLERPDAVDLFVAVCAVA